MAQIIDGKARALKIREDLKGEVDKLKEKKVLPRLDVLLVGDNPASQTYVRNKERACGAIGIESVVHRFPITVKEEELIHQIKRLNGDKEVHGILVQLPLPETISVEKVLDAVSPAKDVDGLHNQNMGMLIKGEGDPFISCTPQGIIDLILSTKTPIKGKHAVVIGRSNIVGKPVAILLLREHATVTICHSRTADLPSITKQADILVAAIGKAQIVKKDMIKPGAVVIDVGMNRNDVGKLVGDVDFEKAKELAGFITPVPGGVGPMTIAMLLKNTLKAASKIVIDNKL